MTGLFGAMGEGRTVRGFALVAAFTSFGAVAFGVAADRSALTGRSAFFASFLSRPQDSWSAGPRVNAIDYATTGSLQSIGQREFIVLGPCGRAADQK
jgi:hypothetical protein